MSTAALPALRWRERRHSFRPAGEVIRPERYAVRLMHGDSQAKDFITRHHYSGTYPAARLRCALEEEGRLVGVAVFSVPVSERVLTSSFPCLDPYAESLELGRFVLLDEVPANAESWFLARCFRLIAEEGVRGVVSFSDPVPRTRIDGSVLMPGHVGTIYQALGALHDLRRSTARTLLIGPDGRVVSPRAIQKIRAGETGSAYACAQLARQGAPPRRTGESATDWIARALRTGTLRRMRHPGNLRYLFRIGRTRRERSRVTVTLTPAPYPKARALMAQAR